MKYKRLYKLNARQDDDSNFLPSEGSKTGSNYDTRNQAADNINTQKVKSLVEAMQRILSSGEKKQQQQRSAGSDNHAKNLGCDHRVQNEESQNGSRKKTANSR